MNQIVKKVAFQNLGLKKLEERINELENLTASLSMKIRDESNKRINFEDNTLTNQTGNEAQIQTLKEAIKDLGNLVNDSIEDIKIKNKKDLNELNLNLQNYIDNKIKYVNSDNLDVNYNDNNILQKNYEELNLKIFNLNNDFKNSFKNYKDELNSNITKIDYFEKKLTDNINNIKEEIKIINKEILDIKNEIRGFKSFKENSNNNFRMIKGDILKQEEIITNFTNKITLMINEYEEKLRKFENDIIEQNKKYTSIKEDLISHITVQDNKITTKLIELNDIIQDFNINQCNEINNFEKHILNEEDKFNQFIQDKINHENETFKKLFSYNDDKINEIKSKCDHLENNCDILKNQVLNNLSEIEEFFTKKYDSLFKIISTQNSLQNKNDNSFISELNNSYNNC